MQITIWDKLKLKYIRLKGIKDIYQSSEYFETDYNSDNIKRYNLDRYHLDFIHLEV